MLFEASGSEFAARVDSLGRAEAISCGAASGAVDRELPIRLTSGVSLPKGDRQRWLVEKAVELGVGRLVPLLTAAGWLRPRRTPAAGLDRAVVEASKQCGRNRLMQIRAG